MCGPCAVLRYLCVYVCTHVCGACVYATGGVEADLAANVVAVAEPAKLLLAGGVPAAEDDATQVGEERQGVHFDAHGGDVLLVELAGPVALDEGGLADTTVADENKLELRSVSLCVGARQPGPREEKTWMWRGQRAKEKADVDKGR